MERQLYAMHNQVRFVTDQPIDEAEWEELVRFFHYVDRQWSRFDEQSEVSRLNRLRIGDTLSVSLPLARLPAPHDISSRPNVIFPHSCWRNNKPMAIGNHFLSHKLSLMKRLLHQKSLHSSLKDVT